MNSSLESKKFKSFFLKVAKPYQFWFIAMLFVGVYSSVHSVMQPYVLKVLLDSAATAGPGQFLESCLRPGILLIILSFVITAVWRFYNYVVLKSLPKIKADIIQLTTAHLRDQSFGFFQDNLSGAISARISDLTSNVQSIVNAYFNILRQGLTIILSIGMAGLVNSYFSVIFLSVSLAFIYIAYYCSHSIKPYASAYAHARSLNVGGIVDCFANVLNMLLFSREAYEADYLHRTTNDAVNKDVSMQFKNMLNATLLGGFAWLLQGSSLILLLYLGDQGAISVGDFAFIFILSMTVIDQIWFLTESLLVVGEQTGICENAIKLIFTEHQQKHLPTTNQLKISNGDIVISNVNFSYKPDKTILNNLSLDIPGGHKIGLVGYSGGGKSTLVQLITKLFDVDSGDILIDGQSIKAINRQRLREKIAFIPQSPTLFHRTIYDNILYGDINARREDVISASKKAHAHDFISELPDGYDTLVGERGLKLSGGQRQRIAIARAILKDAPILILDEATSSLDSITEKLIQESLQHAMQNRTVIVIAHRLSTILSMDKIYVMDNGQIIESGPHHELIEANGFYKSLWDTQSGHSII